ncbi:MAG: ATP-binding cassette domain-containing protein [Bdellovibrionales bacterium]|nr:ATP-binding cassette domain-containing protein [Bdellovibrionales bacterium]
MMEVAIDIQNLRKSFDGKDFVLNGINLTIPKGKITVIIGFSGTGKSVLLKHILGLIRPTSGNIQILGRDLWSMEQKEINLFRRKMGVLFQYAALFDDMTALENVCFPLREHRRDLKLKEIVDIAMNKLKVSGLDQKHFNKIPSEMSGGMRKRVGLARALALDPEILLYDEPTTGLDPILTEMVDHLIKETHHVHTGSTTVVVSHDLFAAFSIGEHIVMLDKGTVLLSGTPDVFRNSDIELVQRFLAKGFKTG